MRKEKLIWVMIFILTLQITMAVDSYRLDPMNFPPDESRTHHIYVSSPLDMINVTIPQGFSLLSGNNNGIGLVDFYVNSPNSSTNGDLHYFNISINNTFYSNLIALSVPDIEIVDNKWELGHGDFNYPSCQFLPDENSLVFPLIRIWGVGTDILNEPATDVQFTCNYPKIRPRTVDSKFTTDYTDPSYLIADGYLSELEGISMFRVFVLSQEINYSIGDNYEVVCADGLFYNFTHHSVNATMSPINISIVDSNPFVISTTTTSTDYVEYTILNNASYEIRDLEFEWKKGTLVHREKLDSMDAGETVSYRVWANGNPSIVLTIRQKPCWMFNSRSPTYYETIHTGTYSINSDTEDVFSVEHKTYVSLTEGDIMTYLQNISLVVNDLDFLFKINQEDYYAEVFELPQSQQNELNFTCYRLALSSNGFNSNPIISIDTNAVSSSEIIIKNELFQTKEFDFTLDQSGVGIASWQAGVGLCDEINVQPGYVCPVTYNYFCVAEGILFKAEEANKEEALPTANCIFCKEKILEVGAKLSPSNPALGFLVLIVIIGLLIYFYYYYEDEISLKNWIQGSKQAKERNNYYKWKEERNKKYGGKLH